MSKGMNNKMRLALSALCLAATSGFAPLALAQTVCGGNTPGPSTLPPSVLCTEETVASVAPNGQVATGQTCGFSRGATGCTANDFVGNANVISNTITSCHIGDTITNQSLQFTVQSASPDRYGVGLFIGEQNQNLNATGGSCTVATFPTSNNLAPARVPFPWNAANAGDKCGSYSGGFTSLEQIDGVTMKCAPDASGNLGITFLVTYYQSSGKASACTGPGNVTAGSGSKCSSGGTTVTNVVVSYNANPTCSAGLTYDPVHHTVSATFHVVNNGPDSAGPALGGDVTFTDTVPAPATVTNVTCGNAAGGAVCGTTGFTGNVVTGAISTLPNGGSVDITISGTVPANPGNIQLSDSFMLIVNANQDPQKPPVVVVPAEWNNTCASAVQLPVRLQDFDVK